MLGPAKLMVHNLEREFVRDIGITGALATPGSLFPALFSRDPSLEQIVFVPRGDPGEQRFELVLANQLSALGEFRGCGSPDCQIGDISEFERTDFRVKL